MNNCQFCNKKYKRDTKLAEHIEEKHPYACHGSNRKILSLEQRTYLLHQLKIYVKIIELANKFIGCSNDMIQDAILQYINWNGIDDINEKVCFIWSSHMLLPQDYNEYIKRFLRPANFFFAKTESNIPNKLTKIDEKFIKDLDRITQNHLNFCHKIQEIGLLQKVISGADQLDLIFDEFNCYLNLGYNWRGDNFCPSMIIDLIWHASMINHNEYVKLTTSYMGKILPHCLEENETEEKQKSRIGRFLKQYKHFYGKDILQATDLQLVQGSNVFDSLEEKYTRLHKENEEKERQLQKEYTEQQKKRREELYKQVNIRRQKESGYQAYLNGTCSEEERRFWAKC